MTTPNYLGAGQPPADSETGLIARIGAFFGSRSTPAYTVAPIASVAPAAPASVAASAPSASGSSGATAEPTDASANAITCDCACHIERESPIDPLLAGRIAIVVPQGFQFPGA